MSFLIECLRDLQVPIVQGEGREMSAASLHLALTRAHAREFSIAYSTEDKAHVKEYVDKIIEELENTRQIRILNTVVYGIGPLSASEMDKYFGVPQKLTSRSYFAGKANRMQRKDLT